MKKGINIDYLVLGFVLLLFASCSTIKQDDNIGVLVLKKNWQIQSQNNIAESNKLISTSSIKNENWIDVELPTTVLNALVKAGIYKDLYVNDNLAAINTDQFNQPWWYRTEFNIDEVGSNLFRHLVFEGVNYRANVWVNGNLVADSSQIEGAFGIWNIDITNNLQVGNNVLAVQVFPPKSDDLTIGFVDWNPAAPDKNLGLWRPVKIETTGAVSIDEPFVKTSVDLNTLKQAKLSLHTKVTNHTSANQSAELKFRFDNKTIAKTIELEPNEEVVVALSSTDFPELAIENPKLWWPNLMGEPNLYKLEACVISNNVICDAENVRFGIREVEDYWTKDGHRGYKVNGKKVLIKGGGWVDDILLADTDEKVIAQVEYTKHMNLNCIRLEGFWGNNKVLYETADELGILLMIGWSCHWEWEGYCGRYEDDFMAIRTPEDQELQARAFQDQVKWLRNHTSVFLWAYGSDKLPLPELEEKLNTYINEVDGTRPILASCKYEDFDIVRNKKGELIGGYINESEVSGPTGVKMLGPYAYTAPEYWYIDKRAGGAYGFNTETGPGAQVPPIESIKRMISVDKIWPKNELWDYHSGRNEFATLKRFDEAFNARYGAPTSVEDYAFRAQISNYEAIRAMFEAFEVNRPNTTGIIQWMLNSAWPEFFWQLYDWYLMPNGAFYGTKAACRPINIAYNYGDKNIYLTNSTLKSYSGLHANVNVYDINSKLIFNKATTVDLNENCSQLAIEMPELKNLTSTYFVSLSLKENEIILADNFYWLSTKKDVHDWESSEWFYTPYKSYADFTALNSMPQVQVEYSFVSSKDNNGNLVVDCTLENKTDKIAFFIELAIVDKATDKTILPVFWDDNYVSLMPGETRTINANLKADIVNGKELDYRIKGLNIK